MIQPEVSPVLLLMSHYFKRVSHERIEISLYHNFNREAGYQPSSEVHHPHSSETVDASILLSTQV